MLIKTTEVLKQALLDDRDTATIAINIPGHGQYIFEGIKHFQIFIEEEVKKDVFGVKELFCGNEEFAKATHRVALRRLSDLV